MALRHVIGLGTGRCGTNSLAYILNSQLRSTVTHEGIIPLSWYKVENELLDLTLKTLSIYPGHMAGDVALYYLNYVPQLALNLTNPKFVCLKRDKEDTIRSYLTHCAERYVSFLAKTFPAQNGPYLWHYARPKYDVDAEEVAIRRYYDEYYYTAEQYERQAPGQFRVFQMERVLNEEDAQVEMLEWLGVMYPIPLVNVKFNQTGGERY